VKTVGQLLRGVTHHAPHHLEHVREKRERLGLAPGCQTDVEI
jgi:hypothetical protein